MTTEIPFVAALGDAFDAAIAAPAPRRRRARRPRRLLAVAVAGLLLAGGGLAVANFLDSPEKLASSGVGCYDAPSMGANVSVPNGVAPPLDACASVYRDEGKPVPALVACARGSAVLVFPGSGDAVCRGLGLAPLPPGYGAARAKVGQLERDVLALERTADCIAPAELAARVQALLDRSGWTGWRTALRTDVGQGPCGTVTGLGGDGRESLAGSLDADHRIVMVMSAPYRSTTQLLYGAGGLAPRLEDNSGTRCFTPAALRADVTQRLAPSGRAVSFVVSTSRPAGETFIGPREQRYQAGCAVITDATPARDGRGIVVTLLTRSSQPSG